LQVLFNMIAVLALNLPVKRKTKTSSTHVMQTKRMVGRKANQALRKRQRRNAIKKIKNVENQNVIVIVWISRLVGRKSRLIVENHRTIVRIKLLINRIGLKVGISRPIVVISRFVIGIGRPMVKIDR
jgi:hypothetical protein